MQEQFFGIPEKWITSFSSIVIVPINIIKHIYRTLTFPIQFWFYNVPTYFTWSSSTVCHTCCKITDISLLFKGCKECDRSLIVSEWSWCLCNVWCDSRVSLTNDFDQKCLCMQLSYHLNNLSQFCQVRFCQVLNTQFYNNWIILKYKKYKRIYFQIMALCH